MTTGRINQVATAEPPPRHCHPGRGARSGELGSFALAGPKHPAVKTAVCDAGQRLRPPLVCTRGTRLPTPFPLPPPRFPQHLPPHSRLRRQDDGPAEASVPTEETVPPHVTPAGGLCVGHSPGHSDRCAIGHPSTAHSEACRIRDRSFAALLSSRQSPARYPPGYSAGVPGTLENYPLTFRNVREPVRPHFFKQVLTCPRAFNFFPNGRKFVSFFI